MLCVLATAAQKPIPFCFQHTNVSGILTCSSCVENYHLAENGCYPLFCNALLPNCAQCSVGTPDKCAICNGSEYKIVDGVCVIRGITINGVGQPEIISDFNEMKITVYNTMLRRLVKICMPGLFLFENSCLQNCDLYDLERRICQTMGSSIPYSSDGVTCW